MILTLESDILNLNSLFENKLKNLFSKPESFISLKLETDSWTIFIFSALFILIILESVLIVFPVINEIIKYPKNNVIIEKIVYSGAFINIEKPINNIIVPQETILIKGISKSVHSILVLVLTIEIISELLLLRYLR